MALPDCLARALRDPHDLAPAIDAFTAHLQSLAEREQRTHMEHVAPTAGAALGVRVPELRRIARDVSALLYDDDHQLAKVMAVLWRGPAWEHRAVAALCCDALGRLDLKRLLRFLQKAEKHLGDWASCDALVSGCRSHIREHPDLFLREARNRIASRKPYVRRLGVVMLTPLANDPEFLRLDALLAAVRPCMTSEADTVRNACAWLLRELHRREPQAVEKFLDEFADVPAAAGTLAAVRRKLKTASTRKRRAGADD